MDSVVAGDTCVSGVGPGAAQVAGVGLSARGLAVAGAKALEIVGGVPTACSHAGEGLSVQSPKWSQVVRKGRRPQNSVLRQRFALLHPVGKIKQSL